MKKNYFNFTKCLAITVLMVASIIGTVFVSCKNNSKEKPEVVYFTVAFDSNGGSNVENQKVERGKTAEKPKNPTKSTGNAIYFGEWYSDPDLETLFDFSTPITSDLVLYAKWLSIPLGSYLVTFDSNSETVIQNQIVKGGEKASEPEENLLKNGYAFSHWYLTNENEAFNFAATPINGKTNLSAKWNQSGIYEAAFDDEGFYSINMYEDLEIDSQSGAW